VKSLVLCDTTSRYPAAAVPIWEERIRTTEAKGMEPHVEPTLGRWFTAPFRDSPSARRILDGLAAVPPESYASCCEAAGDFDLRAVLGPKFPMLLPDGFTPFSATGQTSGNQANGAYISYPGIPVKSLKGAGAKFVKDFTKADGRPPDPYSVYAAQAAEAMVAAIAASNGTRADINKKVFALNIKSSILGPLRFNTNGDVTSNPVTIYKIKGGKSTTLRVIVPPKALVRAA